MSLFAARAPKHAVNCSCLATRLANGQEGDMGLGDVVQRLAGKMGGEWLAKTYEAVLGKSCGCVHSAATLNEWFPLP